MNREEAARKIEIKINLSGEFAPINEEYQEAYRMAIEALKQPEIVRCKDCHYGQQILEEHTTVQCFKWNCAEFGTLHEADWYCADGERKAGEKDGIDNTRDDS